VSAQTDTPQLLRVTGPNNPAGFPTLASDAIHTANDAGFYSVDDVAKAVVFMNPTLTMLTSASAQTVLGHIGSNNNVQSLSDVISDMGPQWCQPQGLVDDARKPIRKPDGKQFYTYELHEAVLNASATPSQQSKALIYSDESLKGTRWKLLPGVSVLDMNTKATAAAHRGGAGGYHVGIQDGGPNYGVSVTVNSAGKSGSNFVLDLHHHQQLHPAHVGVRELSQGGRRHPHDGDRRRLAGAARGQPMLAPRQSVSEVLCFCKAELARWLYAEVSRQSRPGEHLPRRPAQFDQCRVKVRIAVH
jgi:hypothetical protein